MRTDLRLAWRGMRRAPIFSITAIGTLALGIASCTAIFSLFYQVLLRSLPVPQPERLVLFHSDPPGLPGGSSSDNMETVFSNPMYRGLRERAGLFQGVAARASAAGEVDRGGGSKRVTVEIVSSNFFDVLGLEAATGRLLRAGDERVAVASSSLADSGVAVGQTVRINGQPFTIVGVTPAKFYGFLSDSEPDLFVSIEAKPSIVAGSKDLDELGSHWLTVFGRLKPGVGRAQALASLQPTWKALLREHVEKLNIRSEANRQRVLAKYLDLRPAAQGINQLEKAWRKPLNALLAMVSVLLLIACGNVASLLVARALARQREVAVRLAVGAGRGQLLRQNLAESLLLTLAGGAAGVALSIVFLRLTLALLPEKTGDLSARLDPAVLIVSLLVVLATNLLFGFLPALTAARTDPAVALKNQSGNASATGAHTRWRQLLVAAQLGLSLALLVGAGLFAKTLFNLLSHNPGFVAEKLVTFSLDAGLSGYDAAGGLRIYRDVQERLAALPRVEAVAVARFGPLSNSEAMTNVTVEGYVARDDDDAGADVNSVGPGYFRVLGTGLIAGREFTTSDSMAGAKVAIVNQAFVRHYFGGRSPLGKHMESGAGGKLDIEIVGLAKDSDTLSLREAQKPAYYTPFEQSYAGAKRIQSVSFFLRTAASTAEAERAIRQIARAVAPNVPVYDLKTMSERVNDSIYTERLSAWLAVLFGCLASMLAAVGLYGLIAFSVVRRTREIGIRLALGALPGQVRRMILSEVLALTGIGMAIGIPVAVGLGRVMSAQLYKVAAGSLDVYVGATVLIVFAAGLAGLIPAVRASRVDPKEALRYE